MNAHRKPKGAGHPGGAAMGSEFRQTQTPAHTQRKYRHMHYTNRHADKIGAEDKKTKAPKLQWHNIKGAQFVSNEADQIA